MKRFLTAFIALVVTLVVYNSCSNSYSPPSPEDIPVPEVSTSEPPTWKKFFDPQWASNSIWDDGQAEVNTYAARRSIYGKSRAFDYTFVTVKETFNEQNQVKTNDYSRDDLFEVIKLNMFARIPTDNYPYHFLTSVFTLRQAPTETYKMTHSSQEWCGNTFKTFLRKGDSLRYTYNSYFDGEGMGQKMLPANTFLMEDQLPYTFRSLIFKDGLSFSAPILLSEISSHARKPRIAEVEIEVRAAELTREEQNLPIWEVKLLMNPTLMGDAQANIYQFDQAYPNTLLGMSSFDGRILQLKETKRTTYW
ncbi:MAG: hypothetical protein AAGI38_07955 [Bacteroidota bacterium]